MCIYNLRRSHDCLLTCFVRQSVLPNLDRFGQLLRFADKHIVNHVMKVYIERNNVQLKLIRYRKNMLTIHVYLCEATDLPAECIAGSFEHKPLWLRF